VAVAKGLLAAGLRQVDVARAANLSAASVWAIKLPISTVVEALIKQKCALSLRQSNAQRREKRLEARDGGRTRDQETVYHWQSPFPVYCPPSCHPPSTCFSRPALGLSPVNSNR
jgi:hypothetical protein